MIFERVVPDRRKRRVVRLRQRWCPRHLGWFWTTINRPSTCEDCMKPVGRGVVKT